MFQYFQCIKNIFPNIRAFGNFKKSVQSVSAFLQTWFFVFCWCMPPYLFCMGISECKTSRPTMKATGTEVYTQSGTI